MDQDEDAHDVQCLNSNEGNFWTHIVADFVQPTRIRMEGLPNLLIFTSQVQSKRHSKNTFLSTDVLSSYGDTYIGCETRVNVMSKGPIMLHGWQLAGALL